MDRLFITILNNALVASWIILAVIILRFVFKKFIKKIPKWVNCLMWVLVAVRLVFPFSIESIFSVVPSAKPVPMDIEYAKVPQIDSGIYAINTVINPVLQNNFTTAEIDTVNKMQLVFIIASYIWVVGVAGLLIYALISFALLKKQVKNANRADKGVYVCDTIDSPFIFGIFRPNIYIPNSLDEDNRLCVIEHEKAHIKRGDFLWKPLGFIILSVYWFNPLCWIAYICLCKDIEYACDEKVTKDKDKDWKVKYCQALLDCSSQRRLVSACPVAFGEVSVKDRVKSVINYKKPAFWVICISVIVCAVVGVCFLTNPDSSTYSIDVVMPSGYDYNQSDEEFSPIRNKLTITLDEGQENTTICLIPTEAKTETEYDEPITLTAGVPVTLEVEKNAWFELGVILNEKVSRDVRFSFTLKNVNVRIATHPVEETQLENESVDEVSVSNSMNPVKTELGDLDGDGKSDYLEYTGMDGYYNHLTLYLTGEGVIYEDEFESAIGESDAVRAVDLDRDGMDELLVTISPRANMTKSVDYAVLKKVADGWKRLDESKSDDEPIFFPIHFTHDQQYVVNITCDGIERQSSFDMEYLWRYWKNVGSTDVNFSEQILDNYDEIYKSPKGTQVGELMSSGIRNVGLLKYEGYPCLVAEYGICGRNQNDFWGNAYCLFDYDANGKIRILDFGFDAAKAELPEIKYHRLSEIPNEAILCKERLKIGQLGKVNVVVVLSEAEHRTNQLVTYLASDDEILYTLNDCEQDLECKRMASPCLYDVDKDGKEELVIYTRYYFGAGPDAIEERDFILAYKIEGYNVTPFPTDMYDYELMNEIKKACNLSTDVTVSETNELVPDKSI